MPMFTPNYSSGPCLYCNVSNNLGPEELLRCDMCRRSAHIRCLRSGIPPQRLLGDNFFCFTCASCNQSNMDKTYRPKITMIQMLILVFYNLHQTREYSSVDGYFHYHKHVHAYIMENWENLFPNKCDDMKVKEKKLNPGCISGQLVNYPQYFSSRKFERSGLYKLQTILPPAQVLLLHGQKRKARMSLMKSPEQKVLKKIKIDDLLSDNSSVNSMQALYFAPSNAKEDNLYLSPSKIKEETIMDDSSQESLDSCSSRNSWFFEKTIYKPQENLPSSIFQEDESPEKNHDIELSKVKTEPETEKDSEVDICEVADENGVDSEVTDIEVHQNNVILAKNCLQKFSLFNRPTNKKTDIKQAESSKILSDQINTPLTNIDIINSKNSINTDCLKIKNETTEENSGCDDVKPNISDSDLVALNTYEEKRLLSNLNNIQRIQNLTPEQYRLRRKLKLRQEKREHNIRVFELDAEVQFVKQNSPIKSCKDRWKQSHQRELKDYESYSQTNKENMRILDRFQVCESIIETESKDSISFRLKLVGKEESKKHIFSPYTLRFLKPFIYRDLQCYPAQLLLLRQVEKHFHLQDPNWVAPPPKPLDYCYISPRHVPAINHLARHFFWPGIDLSEVLHYPDYTCVVLYGQLVVGFGILVPDTNENEAYVSFLLVLPKWRKAGIASFILYHLIQTCPGKDITLHVSATNPALIMYQKFGFKVEEFLHNFYDKYLPDENTNEFCKHAMYMRLNR